MGVERGKLVKVLEFVGVWGGGATLENQKGKNVKFGNYPPFWKKLHLEWGGTEVQSLYDGCQKYL